MEGGALLEQQLIRIGCALRQMDWGVSGLHQKGLNSSQGRPKRTDRVCRKRHATGNFSIQLKFSPLNLSLAVSLLGLTLSLFSNSLSAQISEQISEQINEQGRNESALIEAPSENPEYRQVGDAFENMMMQNLYQQMRRSRDVFSDQQGMFAPSNGEKIFRSMQEQQMMEALSKRRPLGVSDLVVRQLEGKGGVRTRPTVNYR